MATSLSSNVSGSKPSNKSVSRPFGRMMAVLLCVLVFFSVIGHVSLHYLVRNNILNRSSRNYAEFFAGQITAMIGDSAEPEFWQYDLESLSAVLTRGMRVESVSAIQILNSDGEVVLEKFAAKKPAIVKYGEHEIRLNNRLWGRVRVALAYSKHDELPWSLGYLIVARLATETAQNYGILISNQVSVLVGKLTNPEYWEYDAEKISIILSNAIRLDGVVRVIISDKDGNPVAEKSIGPGSATYLTNIETGIIYNGRIIGRVRVYLDFPGIRTTEVWFLTAVSFILLGFTVTIYILPVRTVRSLERNLLESYAGLEVKVAQRTALLDAANNKLLKDLEESKLLKASLLQSERLSAVGILASGVAHDFNNLLTSIMGNAGFLLRGLAKDDPKTDDVKAILASSERAADLTRQLLAFSRKQMLNPKKLDLNMCLGEIVSMLKRTIGEDIKIETCLENKPCRITVDLGQINQVLMNLAVNARDAMPRGGTLTLKTELLADNEDFLCNHPEFPRGPIVCLTVRDTGCGIPAKDINHIFEPFFTSKEQGKGTGLGLATVFGIIKQSRGEIEVESDLNHGTTFRIYFPYTTEAILDKDKDKDLALKGSETVLLVDDDESLRRMTERLLRASGYVVIVAADGKEALQAAEGHGKPVDLLLTDVVMPGMSGKELSVELGRRKLVVRTLYMSGYTDDAIVSHGVLEPGIAFIYKPFSLEALSVKLREVLDSPAGHAKP